MGLVERQSEIITTFQELLITAIKQGDWGTTKHYRESLYNSVRTLEYLREEDYMALKDKIELIKKAIAEKDAKIAALEAENAVLKAAEDAEKTELVEGEKAADELLGTLNPAP